MFTLSQECGEIGAYLEETNQNSEGGENHALYEAAWSILACLLIYSFTKPFQSSYVQVRVLRDRGIVATTTKGFQQWSL